MEFDLGLVPQNRQQQDLYKVAYHCAACHAYKNCNACSKCDFNIDRMGYNPVETRLIKARAQVDYKNDYTKQKAIHDVEKPLLLSVLGLLVFLIVFTFVLFKGPWNV
jgi:hypothetical protein